MSDGEAGGLPLGRRELLVGVPAASFTLAGCVDLLDQPDVEGAADGTTPTPTYGYGGSTTATGGTTAAGDDHGGDDAPDATTTNSTGGGGPDEPADTDTATPGSTATGTPTPTPGSTATGTPTPTPVDDYGLQRYGEYGYGG